MLNSITAKVNQVASSSVLDIDSFETILNQWCNEDAREFRFSAREKIWNFYVSSEETILDLSALNLTSLPDIFHLQSFQSRLTRLNLSSNKLRNLPDSLGNLTTLIDLCLSFNELTNLPDSLGNLQALRHLYLSYNKLRNLPDSLGNLQALRQLNLNSNKLGSLPDSLGNLQALTNLNLSSNELKNLPDPLGNLQALTNLHLNSNELKNLPDSLGNLQALTNLNLSSNELRNLPYSLTNLEALTELNLSYNKLITLPDSFGKLGSLTKLKLIYNKIRNLPDSLGNLRALTELNLSSNELTTLPNSLGNLQALTNLDLNSNKLRNLPDSLVNLKALTNLDLSSNELITLPDSLGNLQALTTLELNSNELITLPDSLGNLKALTGLNLIYNKLRNLPDSLGNLQALINLNLSFNELRNLPDSLGNLQALKQLYLASNKLRSLPDSLGNLQALTELNLVYNPSLSGLSMYILNLSTCCTIDITGCDLSQTVLENIREITTNPTYTGPRISFSIFDRNHREEKSIKESLKDLYGIADKPIMEFSNLEKIPTLRSWLNRLSDIADYQKQGDLQKAFVNKIIEYLELANKDPAFHDTFCCVIEDAPSTCGDRMALSILDLGIVHKLVTINLKDTKALANFLIKGPWTIEMLKEIARNKIPSLPFFDEIEVYLGYPIKLKQELNIPIDVQEMLYFTCSALKEKDLQEAKDFVLSKQRDQKACFEFLINHDKWREALFANYQEAYQAILDKKTKASESNNPDYKDIKEKFNQELMSLTKKALG